VGQMRLETEDGRLFDGQVAGLGTVENLVDVDGGAVEEIAKEWTIGHEEASLGVGAVVARNGDSVLAGKIGQVVALSARKPSARDQHSRNTLAVERREGGVHAPRLVRPSDTNRDV